MNAACSTVSRPTPHRIFLLRSLCTFPSRVMRYRLKKGRGRSKGRKGKGNKRNPPPFFSSSQSPLPFSKQATTIRTPGSGHTFWFYSFVLWVQREYRARLEISYIDFFFQEERKLYFFSFLKGSVLKERLMLCPGGEWNRRIFFGRVY